MTSDLQDVTFVVTNTGDRPAVIMGATYHTPPDPLTNLRSLAFLNDTSEIVAPGETKIVKERFSNDLLALRATWRVILNQDKPKERHVGVMPSGVVFGYTNGTITVPIRNFDGKIQNFAKQLWLDCGAENCLWLEEDPKNNYRNSPEPPRTFVDLFYR